MHKLGHTRSTNQRDHLLHTPDTFVRTVLPGMERATAVVHISPAAGAAFTQYTAELEPGGTSRPHLQPSASSTCSKAQPTSPRTPPSTPSIAGSFAYIPEDVAHTLTAQQTTRLAVIEKPYEPLAAVPAPEVFVGREEKAPLRSAQRRSRPPGSQPPARLTVLRLRRQHHDLPARRRAQPWSKSTSWSTAC